MGSAPIPRGSSIYFRRQTDDLPTVLNRFNGWWDELCRRHGSNPRSEFCEELGYYVAELVKNALRFSNRASGTLFRLDLVEVVVVDDGEGIADPRGDTLVSLGGGHGLLKAMEFANWFSLESRGRAFTKVSRYGPVREVGKSGITTGTRIDLIKLRPRSIVFTNKRGVRIPEDLMVRNIVGGLKTSFFGRDGMDRPLVAVVVQSLGRGMSYTSRLLKHG